MKNITNIEITRQINGGKTYYFCPWNDYRSTNFWKTYAHAIAHAYRKGWFDLPLWMIGKGFGL